MNDKEKALRWVVNQIPDFTPKSNEEKMILAIKHYCEAGADEIKRLEAENTALRERLDKAVELPFEIGTTVFIVKEKNFIWKETHIATGKIILYVFDWERLSIRIAGSYPDHDFEYTVYPKDYNKTWFTDRAAAEKRLAELKGGD